MIPYILHVSILIAAGFLFYKLLLKKLTFYALNRWILLSCLVVAFVLPLLPIPRQWSWQERIVSQPEVWPRVKTTTPVMDLPVVVVTEEDTGPAVSTIVASRKPAVTPLSTTAARSRIFHR